MIEHPASLFQDPVGAAIGFRRRFVHAQLAVDHLLGDQAHFGGDALPFRHLWRGPRALELVAEHLRVRIRAQRRPGRAPWRQVAGERVQRHLLRRLRQPADQRPGRVGMLCAGEQHQRGAAGDGGARTVGPRQRHRAPLVLQCRRQALAEFGNVPGTGDVEAVIAVAELVPDIGNGGVGDFRRPALVEHFLEEGQRALVAGAAEIAEAAAIAQQGIALLDRQIEQRLELVERQQDGEALRADQLLDRGHRGAPLVPVARQLGQTRLREQIAAHIGCAGFGVPGQAVQRAIHHASGPGAGEPVGRCDVRCRGNARVQRLECAQRGKLRHPGIAQRADIRQGITGKGGQEFLVRGRPGLLLQLDADLRMQAAELGQHLADDFTLGSHGPEAHQRTLVGALARARAQHERPGDEAGAREASGSVHAGALSAWWRRQVSPAPAAPTRARVLRPVRDHRCRPRPSARHPASRRGSPRA